MKRRIADSAENRGTWVREEKLKQRKRGSTMGERSQLRVEAHFRDLWFLGSRWNESVVDCRIYSGMY